MMEYSDDLRDSLALDPHKLIDMFKIARQDGPTWALNEQVCADASQFKHLPAVTAREPSVAHYLVLLRFEPEVQRYYLDHLLAGY